MAYSFQDYLDEQKKRKGQVIVSPAYQSKYGTGTATAGLAGGKSNSSSPSSYSSPYSWEDYEKELEAKKGTVLQPDEKYRVKPIQPIQLPIQRKEPAKKPEQLYWFEPYQYGQTLVKRKTTEAKYATPVQTDKDWMKDTKKIQAFQNSPRMTGETKTRLGSAINLLAYDTVQTGLSAVNAGTQQNQQRANEALASLEKEIYWKEYQGLAEKYKSNPRGMSSLEKKRYLELDNLVSGYLRRYGSMSDAGNLALTEGTAAGNNFTKGLTEINRGVEEKKQQSYTQMVEGLSPGQKIVAELGYGATKLGKDIGVSAVTGVPLPVMYGVSGGAQAMEKAREEGYNANTSLAMGVGSGAITGFVESLFAFGGNNAAKIGQRLLTTEMGKKVAAKLSGKALTAVAKVLSNPIVQRTVGEGIEEGGEYYLQAIYEAVVKDKELDIDHKEAVYSTLMGMGVALVTGSPGDIARAVRNYWNGNSDQNQTIAVDAEPVEPISEEKKAEKETPLVGEQLGEDPDQLGDSLDVSDFNAPNPEEMVNSSEENSQLQAKPLLPEGLQVGDVVRAKDFNPAKETPYNNYGFIEEVEGDTAKVRFKSPINQQEAVVNIPINLLERQANNRELVLADLANNVPAERVQAVNEDVLPDDMAEELWAEADKSQEAYLKEYSEGDSLGKGIQNFDEGNQKALARQSFNENKLIKALLNQINFINDEITIKAGGKDLRQDLKQKARLMSKEMLTTGMVSDKTKSDFIYSAIDGARVRLTENYNRSLPIRQLLKNSRIQVSDYIKQDFTHWQEFRKKNFSRMNLVNAQSGGGMNVDVFYDMLIQKYPGELNPDIISPAEQLRELSTYLEKSEKIESSLKDYHKLVYGEDIEIQDIYRNFETAFNHFTTDSKKVVRYAKDAYERNEAKKDIYKKALEQVPENVAIFLSKEKEVLQRKLDRFNRASLMTEEDRKTVDALLKGAITLDEISLRYNIEDIKRSYELRKSIQEINETLQPRKKAIYQLAYTEVENVMAGVNLNSWTNHKAGFTLEIARPEDIFGKLTSDKATAKKLTEFFIRPIIDADNEGTRDYNRYFNPLNDYAETNQMTKNERNLAFRYNVYRQNALQAGADSQQAMENRVKMDEVLSRAGERGQMIKELADLCWKIMPELMDRQNKTLVQNGYDAKKEMQNYFPLAYKQEPVGFAQKMTVLLGGKVPKDLPTDLAGRTGDFKPGRTYNAHLQARTGAEVDMDANILDVMAEYLNASMETIHKTKYIRRLRNLSEYIRKDLGGEGLQNKIDAIRNDPELDPSQADELIMEMAAIPVGHLSSFVSYLDNYTNIMANKKSIIDRCMEHMLGRSSYALLSTVENRFAANMIAGNIRSMFSQIMPLVQGIPDIGQVNMLKAFVDTTFSRLNNTSDELFEESGFLQAREGKTQAREFGVNRAVQLASMPFNWMDKFVSEIIVRGFQYQNGGDIQQASKQAGSLMADRTKGALPLIFHSKNPLYRAVTMFQVENLNQYRHIFGQMKNYYMEGEFKKLAIYTAKHAFYTYLFSLLWEKFFGGQLPIPNPLGMAEDAVKNYNQSGSWKVTKELITDLASETPFIGGFLGGGRLPVNAMVPNFKKLGNSFFGEEANPKKALSVSVEELSKPLAFILPPGGGNQIRKTAFGLAQHAQGAEYQINAEGEKQLKYLAGNPFQLAILGRSATKEASEYYDKGYEPFTVEETKVVQNSGKVGLNRVDAVAAIRSLKGIRGDDEDSQRVNQRQALMKMESLTPPQKSWLDRKLWDADMIMDYSDPIRFEISLLGKTQATRARQLEYVGLPPKVFLETYKAMKTIEPERRRDGSKIEGSDKIKLQNFLSKQMPKSMGFGPALRTYEEFGLISTGKVTKAIQELDKSVQPSTLVTIDLLTKNMEGDKDDEGNTIDLSKGRKVKEIIDLLLPKDTQWMDRVKIYQYFDVSKELY